MPSTSSFRLMLLNTLPQIPLLPVLLALPVVPALMSRRWADPLPADPAAGGALLRPTTSAKDYTHES